MYRNLNPSWLSRCVLALAVIGAPTFGLAQTPPKAALSFPSSLEHKVLAGWMARETDLTPDLVVAISPVALVAIIETRPMTSPQGFEVTVRAETIDEGFSRQEGLASWNATMKLACKDRTFAMGEVTGHPAHSLKGGSRPMQTATTEWRPVTPGTIQGEIWNARCAPDFKPPLADLAVVQPPPAPVAAALKPVTTTASVAATAPPPPEPAPKPAPPPPKPIPAAAPPTPKPTPAPKPASGPVRATSAQILSAPTRDEAQRALAKLKSRLGSDMAGLRTEVVAVVTDGKTRHRAIVSGFTATGEASRFCEKVTAAGGKCFARNDTGRAASEKAP